MNKKAAIIIAAVIVLGLGILLVQNSKNSSNISKKLENVSSIPLNESKEVVIEINGYSFKTEILKIKKGTKVTWQNKDFTDHTVTSDDGNYFSSPLFGRGKTFEKTFDQTGTFKYHCTPHSQMKAAIVVVD